MDNTNLNIMKPALLFEYEKISDVIMAFGNKTFLKLEISFGGADKNGDKNRSYNEYRYKSSKYDNTDRLISASRKFDSCLVIEYPRQDEGPTKTQKLFIFSYSLDGLLAKMREFDSKLLEPFMQDAKTGELLMTSGKVSYVSSSPSKGSKIEFSQDIFEVLDDSGNVIDKDIGVRIGLNDEFFFTVRAFTVWKSFLNYISHCDLYLWGSTLMAPYTANIIGTAVSDIGGVYMGSASYNRFYAPDPDDIEEAKNVITMNSTKSVTKEDKKKSFFDE